MTHETHSLQLPLDLENFSLSILKVKSEVLKKNQLGDSATKNHWVLCPKGKGPFPLVVHLAGYLGNGGQSFQGKTFEPSFAEAVVSSTNAKKIPAAVHVFVDGMTSIGGSQFINSEICGNHSDHLQKELVPLLRKEFPVSAKTSQTVVYGYSSGGYGALHHISVKDSVFGVALALAPDGDFTTSLLPDFYKLAPFMKIFKGHKDLLQAIRSGALEKQKNFFPQLNAMAMSLCYGAYAKNRFLYPIDAETGELIPKHWKFFMEKDPVNFLKERRQNLRQKQIFLKVGSRDEFQLFFAARKIRQALQKSPVQLHYSEFEGGHFGLKDQKLELLQNLKKL